MNYLIRLLTVSVFLITAAFQPDRKEKIITVTGEISPYENGIWLSHEHVLVDFASAEAADTLRYDPEAAFRIILPEIEKLNNYGVKIFVECTPKYLARDVLLLKKLSEATGILFLTNTGYYGAVDNKFIPENVFSLSAEGIAQKWIYEFEEGIEGTGIRPGFIKIGVNRGDLSEFHGRLAHAAALTHKSTGLVIMSHTGTAPGAFQQLEILKQEGVAPDAFIWTHAQSEKDLSKHVEAANSGAWIALDGFRGSNGQDHSYVEMIKNLKENNCLHRLLLSHDAGYYKPEQPDGGKYAPHTAIFEKLIPALKEAGITTEELKLLLEVNPANAFTVKKRLIRF